MEVEAQSLSNFDLTASSPFSYSELQKQEFRGSEMPESPADHHERRSGRATREDSEMAAPLPVDGPRREVAEEDAVPIPAVVPAIFKSSAAMKVQKVYRSYRTRRMLADSAVVAEELWWLAIDYARLSRSTISFFNFSKPETPASRWNRIILNASKVGKGLSKDAKAQKLAFQHWIEAIDPRHRYGHCLHKYYEEWCKTDAGQPFFYWLDVGDGTEVDLKDCPRSKLRQLCIKYLGPQEREHYEYIVMEGKIVHKLSGTLLHTTEAKPEVKWIFVMSTSKKLYAGQKKKGVFHHSSFLAGGASLAAGRLEAEDGILRSISPYSGHYRPTEDSLDGLLSFLKENGVNIDEIEIRKANEDYENLEESKSSREEIASEFSTNLDSPDLDIPKQEEKGNSPEPTEAPETETETKTETETETKNNYNYRRTLSGGLKSPRAEVPKTAILERINSKNAARSYQLGYQLSRKWSTGAGPRIGCVADYPVELRLQALEFVNLSPRTPQTPSSYRLMAGLASPTSCPVSPTACLASDLHDGNSISNV